MNAKQIKEDYFLISKDLILAFLYIILILVLISLPIFLLYKAGETKGYNNGWDDSNKGIVDILENYDVVNLFWANGTEVGLKLHKYEEPQMYFASYNLYGNDNNSVIFMGDKK